MRVSGVWATGRTQDRLERGVCPVPGLSLCSHVNTAPGRGWVGWVPPGAAAIPQCSQVPATRAQVGGFMCSSDASRENSAVM